MFVYVSYGRKYAGYANSIRDAAVSAGFRVYLVESSDPEEFHVVAPGVVVDGNPYKALKIVEWLASRVRGDGGVQPGA